MKDTCSFGSASSHVHIFKCWKLKHSEIELRVGLKRIRILVLEDGRKLWSGGVWPRDILRQRHHHWSRRAVAFCVVFVSCSNPLPALHELAQRGILGVEPEASCRFSVTIIPCKLGVAVTILPALELAGVKLEDVWPAILICPTRTACWDQLDQTQRS